VSSHLPLVSVIIPCRNEAEWIQSCLESVAENDYPKERIEVLVVDGMSDDGTREKMETLTERFPFVRLLDNPRRITPAALNVGIEAAKGSIIMRMDAHYEYPKDYISVLVHWLEESGADNVGGSWVPHAANETPMAKAIAIGVAHPFGVGNAHYRLGTSEPRHVDTVPFGCYRREVFDRIGVFDEELVRNQDLEFNRRLTNNGGKILLVPNVAIHGCARDSLCKLSRLYYQYGYFNPLVVQKTGGKMTSRQVVTPTFVTSLFLSGVFAPWFRWAAILFGAILTAYAVPVVAFAVAAALKRGLRCGLALCVVFPTLHVAHGSGFLKGVLDFTILRRNPGKDGGAIPLSR